MLKDWDEYGEIWPTELSQKFFSELDLPVLNDGNFRQLKTTEAVAFTSLLFQTLFGFKKGNVYR